MTVAQTPLLVEVNTPLHVASGGEAGQGIKSLLLPTLSLRPEIWWMALPPHHFGLPYVINPEDYAPTVNKTPRDLRLRVSASRRVLQSGFLNQRILLSWSFLMRTRVWKRGRG